VCEVMHQKVFWEEVEGSTPLETEQDEISGGVVQVCT
jgi:hypothetical protein